MSNIPRVLVIPDIHGRTFWKEAIQKFPKDKFPDLKIIFLGDYLDPYTSLEGITEEDAYNNFLEILDVINSDSRVIPLIGNHDWHYFVHLDSCRIDIDREKNIEEIFKKNISKFRLTYTVELKDKKYLFSHAGITQKWLDTISSMAQYEYEKWNPGDPLETEYKDPSVDKDYKWLCELCDIDITYDFDLLEECLKNYDNTFYTAPISMISRERGGWYTYGSCIWADIREHIYNKNLEEYFQIFAHTNTYPYYKAITSENKTWMMIDCRKAFAIYDNDTIEKIN